MRSGADSRPAAVQPAFHKRCGKTFNYDVKNENEKYSKVEGDFSQTNNMHNPHFNIFSG